MSPTYLSSDSLSYFIPVSHGVGIVPQRAVTSDNYLWLENSVFLLQCITFYLKLWLHPLENRWRYRCPRVSIYDLIRRTEIQLRGKENQTCSLLQSDQLSPKTTALEHSMRKAWTCEVACSSFRLILTKGSHWSKPAGDPCPYLSQRGHTVIPEPQIEFRADTELQIGKYRVTIKRVIHWAMKVCLLFPQSL